MSDHWEQFGYSLLGTKAGSPFKQKSRAESVAKVSPNGIVVEVDEGFRVRSGAPMTESQAVLFNKNMVNHPLRQYPRPSMGANEKPLSVSRPDLFYKWGQALKIIESLRQNRSHVGA